MRLLKRSIVVALALALFSMATACSKSSITFVANDSAYSFAEVEMLPASLERPDYAGEPTSMASGLRRDALIELRGSGAEATELAEFITRSLPTQARAVPYYGEAAEVEGDDAWVIVELWGTEDGALDRTRTWVFDRASGEVLFSSSGK